MVGSTFIPRRPAAKPNTENGQYTDGDRALCLFKRAVHMGHRAVNDAIRAYGVTPTQVDALNRLVLEPGLSGAELARRLLVTPQAAKLALAA